LFRSKLKLFHDNNESEQICPDHRIRPDSNMPSPPPRFRRQGRRHLRWRHHQSSQRWQTGEDHAATIDCPEKSQPYGQKAKQFTADMVAGKTVKVWETDTDRYGRIVGFVFVGDKNLNKELLSAGLAWHYKKYSRDPELAKLEFEARSAKIGLWSEVSPVVPWEWRKRS